MNDTYAYFITPHGFGHAARAAAVMAALYDRQPELKFEIFTHVPSWFFELSIPGGFNYHALQTDVGLVQTTSMAEDLPETIKRLGDLFPLRSEFVERLARQICDLGCKMVLCDIAPLGIAVAHAAGLPAVLIENFTWDWIYAGYRDEEPRFDRYIAYLEQVFASTTYHIRTSPACSDHLPADMVSGVVSRKPRTPRAMTRNQLGVPLDARLVTVTMGGILTDYPFLGILENVKDIFFLIPGGSDSYEQRGSLILIPHHSSYYHPDLIEACDMVIGKLGYSTMAEAYSSRVPYMYIPRPRFRETGPMSEFARAAMGAIEINEKAFFNGEWLTILPEILSRQRDKISQPNGADQIAEYVISHGFS